MKPINNISKNQSDDRAKRSSQFYSKLLSSVLIRLVVFGVGIGISLVPIATKAATQEDDNSNPNFTAEQIEFFESRIRPLLVERCIQCHGETKSENNFRLDSRTATIKGGDSGAPGAIPRKSHESLIVASVRHQSDYDMPPDGKLSTEQIEDLSRWVDQGLPWPSERSVISNSIEARLADHKKNHWSFQPITEPASTGTASDSASKSTSDAIDSLLLQKLETRGLTFSKPANKQTLIRRVTFDLIGLPPTFEEVQSFVKDADPQAYEKLIERLLASPRYGERWARHWLDVARYADTLGYALAEYSREYPFAYTYRDYVIDAFNNDLPYDQFIREQLAADQLDVPDNDRSRAATGFITVGRKYLNGNDTIDDRVDVVTRGLMGLTVSCARCHDHKFDAVPTTDYYSLFAIFKNSSVPNDLPLIGEIDDNAETKSYFAELEKRELAVGQQLTAARETIREDTLTNIREYSMAILLPDQRSELESRKIIQRPEFYEAVVERLRTHWTETATKTPDSSLEKFLAPIAKTLTSPGKKLDEKITAVNRLADELEKVVKAWREKGKPDFGMQAFSKDDPLQGKARLLFGKGSPLAVRAEYFRSFLNVEQDKKVRKLKKKIKDHDANTPPGVDRAMVLVDRQPPVDCHVMIRGNENRPGELVQRQFIQLLSGLDRQPFKNGAGRLELAENIVSRENPLTARVLVNRVWMHHFVKPLVATPSDFGIRCGEPLQRDVLDLLAADFMSHNWSIKHLHRQIMLSQAYRQDSKHVTQANKQDPENDLLWKMNTHRLEFEPLRDSILSVSGSLDFQQRGRGIDQFKKPFDTRRSIYGRIDRQELPSELRSFDLASPDQSAARRTRTIVPQQGLFLMNSEFIIEQAKLLANKIESKTSEPIKFKLLDQFDVQAIAAFRQVLSRNPSTEEMAASTAFLREESDSGLTRLEQFCQLLLMTNEFELID